MQFKKAGKRIQVLAYRGYDKEKKRAVVKMLGSLDSYSYGPSDGLIESLTEEEKKELQSYIDEQRQSRDNEYRQSSVKYLPSSIKAATDSITNHGVSLSGEEAARLWEAMEALGKALKKSGHPRPKAPAPAPAAPGGGEDTPAGQAALTFEEAPAAKDEGTPGA